LQVIVYSYVWGTAPVPVYVVTLVWRGYMY